MPIADHVKSGFGSAIRLQHKGISDQIITITFEYTASGAKYSETVKMDDLISTTYYFSKGEYIKLSGADQKPEAKFYRHDYRRILPAPRYDSSQAQNHSGTLDSGKPFAYEYYLTDHLGNVRVTFSEKDQVREFLATMDTFDTRATQCK